MLSLHHLLLVLHLFGLTLGVGAASVKLFLLYRCKSNPGFIPVFLKVMKPITQLLLTGLLLLTLTGLGWLLRGFPFTPWLIIKTVLVALIWIIGPVIDKVIEPKFIELSPVQEERPSEEFNRQWTRYFATELIADLLFYIVIVLGVMI